MPLVLSTLKKELQRFGDQKYTAFEQYPQSNEQVGEFWSTAIATYASTIVPPSTSISQAKSQCKQIIVSQLSLGNGFVVLELAIAAFAQQLGLGMTPTFTAIPPSTAIGLSSVAPLGLAGASSEECLSFIAQLIHAWFLTGVSINNGTNVSVNWN